MRLSDYQDILNIEIIRDAQFDTLGNCTDAIDKPFLSFLGKAAFLEKMNANVSCIITTADIAGQVPMTVGLAIATEPKIEYVKLHNHLSTEEAYVGKRFKTIIGNNCNISPMACIAEYNVIIGDNVTIGPFSVVNERVEIRDNVIIRENCIVGGKSYNYAQAADGTCYSIADCGHVVIEENVELIGLDFIGGCPYTTEVTRVGRGTKVGARCHIAHGCHVGANVEMPSGILICGNSNIGDGAYLGPQAVLSNRINVGEGARVSIGAAVTQDVEAHQSVSGNFAIDHERFIENIKRIR